MIATREEPRYVGAPWRSRFLRAPKVALELASRPDFVPLGELATARLGLKTGADKFFYVLRVPKVRRDGEPQLIRRRGTILVQGLDGWTGEIPAADLRPAVLSPHELFVEDGRLFLIPTSTVRLYVYPRDMTPRADLASYIDLAQRRGVHRGTLVRSNGSGERWYRQARAIVTSPWALPYNSAYDYGAWDNAAGAVLNGRFVGIEPGDSIDSDLLGAVLNSTYAIVGRLLEGTATGVEGALDVGPPAARRIRVPDIRKVDAAAASEIKDLLTEVRRANRMPPAPLRDLTVDPLRRGIDLVLLRGLGLTKGEASAITSRLYESYARWRAAVEDVELAMRGNRRTMHRTGQTRSVRPADQAARRVWEELSHTVHVFPTELLTAEDQLELVALPRGIAMPQQESFIDPGAVSFSNGKRIDLGSHDRVRYAAMLSSLGFEPPFEIPRNSAKARAIVDAYERELGSFREAAATRAATYVGDAATVAQVVEAAERHWAAKCREAGMGPRA